MDPLSIIASITGILAAASKVASVLESVRNAPESISDALTEVNHIKIVFTALRRFVERSQRLTPKRASLIQLEDVVVVLTQTVLVFSELEALVGDASKGSLSGLQRLSWTWQKPTALRLVNQLQRHKTSLSLILQIIQWLGLGSLYVSRHVLTCPVTRILKPTKAQSPCKTTLNSRSRTTLT